MSTLRTYADAEEWIRGAIEAAVVTGGDPTDFVCQLFFRWQPTHRTSAGEVLRANEGREQDLVAGIVDEQVVLVLPGNALPMPVRHGAPEIDRGQIVNYGLSRIVPGVWALSPSLNVEGLIHGFVMLYDVPDPAPWEAGPEHWTAAAPPKRLVVLPGEL